MKTVTAILVGSTICASAQLGPPPHSRMLVVSPIKLIPKESPLSDLKVQDNLLSMFKSQIKERRLKGFEAVRNKFGNGELKADDRRLYRVLIGKAADYHLGELEANVEDVTKVSRDEATGIFKAFNKLYGEWYISALNSREMSQTDWRKVQQFGSFQGMKKEVKECFDLFDKLVDSWEKIGDNRDYLALYETCEAINECRAEVSWCDGEEEFKKTTLNRMVTAIPAGVRLKKSLERIDSLNNQVEEYVNAVAFNEKETWASDEVRGMVKILNARRVKFGLECIKLDKVLSGVCKEHSQDMVKRDFFGHKGSDGRDYEARARDAEWYGGTFGEVLYTGSIIPRDVHDAWWTSEDNRPKLYAPHLNRIGVGIIDTTWTAVIGSTYSGPSRRYIIE